MPTCLSCKNLERDIATNFVCGQETCASKQVNWKVDFGGQETPKVAACRYYVLGVHHTMIAYMKKRNGARNCA